MDHDELGAWLRLTLTPGIGNGAARRLLARFGLPQAIFQQTEAALQLCVPAAQAKALREMEEHAITSLFVFGGDDNRRPVGIIHLHDLLKAGLG